MKRMLAMVMVGLVAGGCSSGNKSNQWSGGGNTYGDGVSGLTETSPAQPYWSGSGITVKNVNDSYGALKVEPYAATASGEQIMPLAEFYMVGAMREDSRELRLPRASQQDYSWDGRTLSVTVTALGPEGGFINSWIVPGQGNLNLRAVSVQNGGIRLYSNGVEVMGQ